ncbi:MAG: hypothetical protein LBP59_15870 [Planctomycetaceae bacterium]|nr:hypothetical protein [Planctomycetaceae bacterium]
MRLYSTANERGLKSRPPFVLHIGNKQARRPRSRGLESYSESRALQDRRRFAWCFPDSQGNACIPGSRASRLHAVVLNR